MDELKEWIITYYSESVWESYIDNLLIKHNSDIFFQKENPHDYISKAFLWWKTKEEFEFWLHVSLNWRNRK